MQSASSGPGGKSNSRTEKPPEDGETGEADVDGGPSTGTVVALGVVLMLVFGTATIMFAVDRTALDADYAVETLGEEGVYASITGDLQQTTAEAINDSIDDDAWAQMTDEQRARVDDIPREEIREEYVEAEVTRNVRALYAYIHGERDSLRLSMNVTEPREDVIRAIEDDPDLGPWVDTDEVRAGISAEQNVTQGGEVPDGVETVRGGAGEVGLFSLLLPLLSVGLVGVIYYLTRSVHRTATAAGVAFLVVGVVGLLIGFGLRGLGVSAAESSFNPNAEGLAAHLSDGFVAVVEGMFNTIVTQSVVLVLAGAVVVGLVRLDEEGYLDGVKAALGSGSGSTEQETSGGDGQRPNPPRHDEQSHSTPESSEERSHSTREASGEHSHSTRESSEERSHPSREASGEHSHSDREASGGRSEETQSREEYDSEDRDPEEYDPEDRNPEEYDPEEYDELGYDQHTDR